MLRHASDRLQVQGLLDDMHADSALSRRGGGGGLIIDGTTKKLLKQRCTFRQLPVYLLSSISYLVAELWPRDWCCGIVNDAGGAQVAARPHC